MFTVVVTLAACTGGTGTPTPPSLPTDPCALLSVKDVESTTGHPVVRSGLVPGGMKGGPNFPDPCMYVTHGEDGSITIWVDPQGAATFAQWRDRDPRNNVAIQGIGDEAFVHALATLWVRVGGGYFGISTQLGAGPAGVERLKELAKDVLGNIPHAS
jgi:hypothetical protein